MTTARNKGTHACDICGACGATGCDAYGSRD